MVTSWIEQRAFLFDSISALGSSPLAVSINKSIADILKPPYPPKTGLTKVSDASMIFDTPTYSIGFDSSSGAISYLLDPYGMQWARDNVSLAGFVYRTASVQDYDDFLEAYPDCDYITDCKWASIDFGKLNLSIANPQNQTLYPSLTGLWTKTLPDGGIYFLEELSMPTESWIYYGAPTNLTVEITIGVNVDIVVTLWNKTATRLPEGLFYSFQPNITNAGGWHMNKLSSWINPQDIVLNGSAHMHAVDKICYNEGRIGMVSWDAPVLSWGSPNPFPTPIAPVFPNFLDGAFWNLCQNIWGTNYVMWYPYLEGDPGNIRFRFTIDTNKPGHNSKCHKN